MDDSERASTGFGRWLAAVALGGLAARVAFVLALRPHLITRYDPTLYHLMGLNLADGLGLVRPTLTGHGALLPTAEFGPVLPVFVAAVTKLGVRSADGQALATAALGALTVVVVGLLGRRVAGPRVGIVAATIVAFHPLLVQVDGALATESPYLLLVALLLLTTIRACDAPSVGRWIIVGLVAGLAVLARGEGLVLLAVLVVPAAAVRAWPGWWRALVGVAVPVLAAAVLLVPWTIRNFDEFGRIVPVSNNFGSVMLGANCPSTYEFGARQGGWDFGCVAVYVAQHPKQGMVSRSENEAEVYARWRSAGIQYALDHPGGFLAAFPARLARTWGVYWLPGDQIHYDLDDGRDRTLQTIGFVVALVLLVLAVGGVRPLLRSLGARRWVMLVLAAPVAVTVLMAFATYGSTRFRIVAEPSIAVLAAYTLVSFADRRRTRGRSGEAQAEVDETVADGRADSPTLDVAC
ncbi:MAG: glycosyltransferase family 39 protein [Acidimicrobiia bacterium]